MPFSYLTDTDSRLHVLYLLSSLLLAYYVYRKAKVEGSFLSYVFSKDVWLSRSAMVDYGLIFFNSLFKVFLIGPYLIFGFYLSYKVEAFLPEFIGYPSFALSASTTIILYTILITIADDFGSYVIHYLMHYVPFLWEFHKIHHSATVLNPVTQYRIHPVELIFNNIKGIVVMGMVMGVFRYLSANPIDELTFIGANIFSFAFLFFGSNLRHSHVPLRYFNWVEYIFISPFQHQIHHSNDPKHFNKNIGAKLAIWDWMFGTLVRSEGIDKVEFGIGQEEDRYYTTVWQNLAMPFRNLLSSIRTSSANSAK
jgi:sterol desaturase/sphingolipid hydroxylase (fatty acid hydroxylase superfamily)